MSTPVFLCEDLTPSRIVLDGAEGRHAAGSRRMLPGEAVDLVDGRGTRASCRVVSSGRDSLVLEVVARAVEPAPSPRLVLVQALPKGDRGELAVELATEVGLDEVVPWVAARCVMQWKGDRGDKQLQRWRSTAREAAKQSRRAHVPEVAALHTTAQVAARLRGATGLVLHEAASAPLTSVALPDDGDVVLVVGPEGGIDERELEVFAEAGAAAVRLGPTVLRTSTAGAAAAAVLSARTGRW
ncbi:MAG: 16S rRNA (uracil(1498)-N(3))-methyltransferase [Actinomycetota bacterium]|nr:16S rRNA (uracil(1498)-N(3))-methyltransferase [Actinomycetota bacterium]